MNPAGAGVAIASGATAGARRILADDEHRRGLALAKGHLNREAADGCLRWF